MKKLIKTGDIIVIAFFLLLAAGMLLIRMPSGTETKSLRALILVDGKTVREIDLNEADGEQIIEAGKCTIRAARGGIEFIGAECPDHICVKSGRLTEPGDMAACVPNKTMIRIVGREEMDAITY